MTIQNDIFEHLNSPSSELMNLQELSGKEAMGLKSAYIRDMRTYGLNSSNVWLNKITPEIPVRCSVTHTDPIRIVNATEKRCPTQDGQPSKEAQRRELLWRFVMEKDLRRYRRENMMNAVIVMTPMKLIQSYRM